MSREATSIASEAAAGLNANPLRVAEYHALLSSAAVANLKQRVDDSLREVRADYAARGVENVYSIVLKAGELWVAGDPSEGSPPILSVRDTAHIDEKLAVFRSGETTALKEPYADDYGVWISAYSPIKDGNGEVLAILGIDLPLGAFPVIGAQIYSTLFYSLMPAVFIAALVGIFISKYLSGPINAVTAGLRAIRAGNFDTKIALNRKDEFGNIAEAFNRMSAELHEKEELRTTLHQAVSPEFAEKMLSSKANPDGDLVEGTALFADIRGFTSLSDAISAKETIAFVNEFLRHSVPQILQQGGIVEKFVGDEIFAVFGGPIALEDDPVKAVEAALNIQTEFKRLNAARKSQGLPEIDFGIGINTGMMVAGVIGIESRNNYTLLGSTVNEAARICSSAKAGEILVGQPTFLRIKKFFESEEVPPLKAKGKEFAMNIFRVSGRKEMRDESG